MPDIEKVLKAIECRKNAHKRCADPCETLTGYCTYASFIRDPDGDPYYPCYCDVERLCDDALTLLRKQEPKLVKITKNAFNHEFYYCPNCDRSFENTCYKETLFCDKCGQAVKWK